MTTEPEPSRHTPGPWEWRGDDHVLVSPALYRQWFASNYDHENSPFVLLGVWQNDSTASIDVSDANARLIAAAPDLLVAVREAVEYFAVLNIAVGPAEQLLIRLLNAAIAKAEGR